MTLYNRTEKNIINHFVNNPKVDVNSVLTETARLIYSKCVHILEDNHIDKISIDIDDVYENLEYGIISDYGDDNMCYVYIREIQLVKPYADREPQIKVISYNVQNGEDYIVNRYDMDGNIYNALSLRQFILDYLNNDDDEEIND